MQTLQILPPQGMPPILRLLTVRSDTNGFLQCDEGRPCSACRIRGLECTAESPTSVQSPEHAGFWPVIATPHLARSPRPSPSRRQSSAEAERDYINAFFEFAVGSDGLSLPLQALNVPYLLPLVDNNDSVRLAITALGATFYADKDGSGLASSTAERALDQVHARLQSAIASTAHPDTPTVLSALLLGIHAVWACRTTSRLRYSSG